MRIPAACLVFIALSACGSSFGHLPGAKLRISKQTEINDDTDFTEAHVMYVGSDDGCELLSEDARVTANGVEITQLFRGSEGYDWFRLEKTCSRPRVTIPASLFTGPEMSVTIEDGGGSIGLTVMNLHTAPVLTVAPDASGHIRAGSAINLSYEPQTDDIQHMGFTLYSPHAPAVSWSVMVVSLDEFFQGHQGQLTIPADTPAGTADLQFYGQRMPQVTRCDGVDTCAADYRIWNIEQSFTIEP